MDCIINMFLIFKWNNSLEASLMHRYAPIYVTQPDPFTYHIFHEPFAGFIGNFCGQAISGGCQANKR